MLVFGAAITFVSLQNTTEVSLTLLQYSLDNVPLYYVIIGSMLIGILLSYLISLVSSISNAFIIRSKNSSIKSKKVEMLEMTKKIHQLQLENAVLKKDSNPDSEDKKSL